LEYYTFPLDLPGTFDRIDEEEERRSTTPVGSAAEEINQ
jgi:hypothetical protein